jgi:predicted nucleic acid-binding protein
MASYSPVCSAIVVDASYIVRMLLPVEQATSNLALFANWRRARENICALDILIADVTSLIRQAVCRQWITAAEGQVSVEDFFHLDVRIIPSDQQLCSSALVWAGRLRHSKACDGF